MKLYIWVSSFLILMKSCLQTCMTYTIVECTVNNPWWWTEELFETCRVSFQNKCEKLLHLVGFIIRKFVTMHGHVNAQFVTMHGHVNAQFVTMHGHVNVKYLQLIFSLKSIVYKRLYRWSQTRWQQWNIKTDCYK
jgi:hypothetical protein